MADMQALNSIIEKIQTPPKKKISGFAKKLTYSIIIITFLLGVIRSFDTVPFDMNAFTSFIPMFSSLFIPLVLSIGINSAFSTHEKTVLEKEIIEAAKHVE
jgi:hypothetical protein